MALMIKFAVILTVAGPIKRIRGLKFWFWFYPGSTEKAQKSTTKRGNIYAFTSGHKDTLC